MKLSNSDFKKIIILSQKKPFLIFCETKAPKKFLIFQKTETLQNFLCFKKEPSELKEQKLLVF